MSKQKETKYMPLIRGFNYVTGYNDGKMIQSKRKSTQEMTVPQTSKNKKYH